MISHTAIKREGSIRRYYLINLEIGLIATLLLFIGMFKMHYNPQPKKIKAVEKQEVVKMEEVVRTKQQEKVPAPPRPQVPVEVPNDEIVQEEAINFSSELDMGEALELPSAPPEEAGKKEEDTSEDEIFVVVENMPELIGGLAHLQSRIEYPEMARLAGIEGRVVVQFTITEKGNVIDPVVVRGIGGGCDEEAIRVIKEAKFKPGMQRGRPVKVRYTIPIKFSLKNTNS